LTIDPKIHGIMQRPPVIPGTNIISNWMKTMIIVVSLTGGTIAFLLFLFYFRQSGNVNLARSVSFAVLGINSLVYVFSVRTLSEPFWKENPFGNKWLNIAVIAGIIFQILPFTNVVLRNFFKLEVLSFGQWVTVFISSLTMFIVVEIMKVFFRREHLVRD
jgi:Ca2+-transporting ATPase